MFIYDDDDESGDDDLCACLRVVHFRGSLALIFGLCYYVYTCITLSNLILCVHIESRAWCRDEKSSVTYLWQL